MKTYTVVGFWQDNMQPWVEPAKANNAQDAAARAVEQLGEGDTSNLIVVEAFPGSLKAELCNREATTIDQMEYEL